MDHQLRKADLLLIQTLAGLGAQFGKTYCFPSQKKLAEIHGNLTGRFFSVRELCRHLLKLEGDDLIRRTRRHTKGPGGNLILKSTLYSLTVKGWAWISSLKRTLSTMKVHNLWRKWVFRPVSTGETSVIQRTESLTAGACAPPDG